MNHNQHLQGADYNKQDIRKQDISETHGAKCFTKISLLLTFISFYYKYGWQYKHNRKDTA
jgi:hypothetical protein